MSQEFATATSAASTPSDPVAEAKENEVLAMFFDQDFVPHAFLDALFTSSMNTKVSSNSMANTTSTANPARMGISQKEFASQASLKSLQSKSSSLLNHLDYYTNELTRQFEEKLNSLQNASSVISYMSNDSGAGSMTSSVTTTSNGAEGPVIGITRLEYYIENLSSSVNSLYRDLKDVNEKITQIQTKDQQQQQEPKDESKSKSQTPEASSASDQDSDSSKYHSTAVRDLNDLLLIKTRLTSVIDIFELAQAIVSASMNLETDTTINTTSLAPTSEASKNERNMISIDIDTFSNSLNIFQEGILEELYLDKHDQRGRDKSADIEGLLRKCDSLIDLLPLFKNMRNYYGVYAKFVEVLEAEKKRYLSKQ